MNPFKLIQVTVKGGSDRVRHYHEIKVSARIAEDLYNAYHDVFHDSRKIFTSKCGTILRNVGYTLNQMKLDREIAEYHIQEINKSVVPDLVKPEFAIMVVYKIRLNEKETTYATLIGNPDLLQKACHQLLL